MFVADRWHVEIIAAIDLDEVVQSTEGLSCAEMDEIKKLLVLRFLDAGRWDWQAAWSMYQTGHEAGKPTQRIGFNSPLSRSRHGVDSRVAANRA
ncbi:MAG TPA: hypothetical protein VGM05_14520 [Planctomycetaceae bacterium]